MGEKQLTKILEQIAYQNHTSVEDVRSAMEQAMAEGMNHPDPLIQAKWREIPKKGKQLTLEELVAYLVKQVI